MTDPRYAARDVTRLTGRRTRRTDHAGSGPGAAPASPHHATARSDRRVGNRHVCAGPAPRSRRADDPAADDGSDRLFADPSGDPVAAPTRKPARADADVDPRDDRHLGTDHDGDSAERRRHHTVGRLADPTQLPERGFASRAGASRARAGSAAGPAAVDWSSDETHDFPAYRPQSYPTYPPTHSQTTELPAVGAGGPPPTRGRLRRTGRRCPARACRHDCADRGRRDSPARPERPAASSRGRRWPVRSGSSVSPAAAVRRRLRCRCRSSVRGAARYFGHLRELATQKLTSSRANAHSVSLAGGHAATVVVALRRLRARSACSRCCCSSRSACRCCAGSPGCCCSWAAWPTIAGYAIGVHQTNDYRSIVGGIQATHRLAVSQLGLGIWVAVGRLRCRRPGRAGRRRPEHPPLRIPDRDRRHR